MKLWITAGGTGSAWHLASIISEYYKDRIELYISDINEKELVASSTLTDHFYRVPGVREKGYAEFMYDLLNKEQIDWIIPLIPWEQQFFAPDCPAFAKLSTKSLAPMKETDEILNHKGHLYDFCKRNHLPVIRQYGRKEILPEQSYFCKPADGFGAMGCGVRSGAEILADFDWEHMVVQDNCADQSPVKEVTVEVFWDGKKPRMICRQRLEAKNGVCTKACFFQSKEIEETIETMTQLLDFPPVFNIQFVEHEGKWKVMDVNLRLAAGTGLSNAAGFQLARALFAHLLGEPVKEEWLQTDEEVKTVLRVYKEVVIR